MSTIPCANAVCYGNIPEELRERPQWVNFTHGKAPCDQSGRLVDHRTNRVTFDEAVSAVDGERVLGIGYSFDADDPYVGIDLDSCRYAKTGTLAAWAHDFLSRVDSYTEITPSGSGFHVICRGKSPWPKGRKIDIDAGPIAGKSAAIEVYDHGRYFTFSGDIYGGRTTIADIDSDVIAEAALENAKTPEPPKASPPKESTTGGDDFLAENREEIRQAARGRWHDILTAAGMPGDVLDGKHHPCPFPGCSKNGVPGPGVDRFRALNDFAETGGVLCNQCHNRSNGDGFSALMRLRGWEFHEAIDFVDRHLGVLPKPDVDALLRNHEAKEREKPSRPEVLVSLNESWVAEQVVRHLGTLGWDSPWLPKGIHEQVKVYSRGGGLCRLVAPDIPGQRDHVAIQPLPKSIIRERITQACAFYTEKTTKDGEVRQVYERPQKWLVDMVADRQTYSPHIRPLEGVIFSPTIRPDGSVLKSPGYDDATGLYFRPHGTFVAVPPHPSKEDSRQAAVKLLEVVRDFPFVDEADKSAWLALVLSLVGRPSVIGCVPMFCVTANVRGSGKSLLVDVASVIAFGNDAARRVFTGDDKETRKIITATVCEDRPIALFDNVDRMISGAALEGVLTAELWEDRILGVSKTTGPLRARTVWCATGNNLAYGGDIARRVLPISLASPLESPEDRSDFVHANLRTWVNTNRGELLVAALTILRAYFANDKPRVDGATWGSFESWTATVRNSLVWAGFADPLDTRQQAIAQDGTRDSLARLICALEEADPDGQGLTTGEIERKYLTVDSNGDPEYPLLREVVMDVCPKTFNASRFGRHLAQFADRVCRGKVIKKLPAGGHRQRWLVSPGEARVRRE